MFTFLGRTLVILFATLSIFCLMAAVAVFTQKMDYATPRGGEAGKKTLNRVDTARNKAKELLVANQRAITRLNAEIEPLVAVEADQLQRRDYYYAQMRMMRTGQWYDMKELVANPIQKLTDTDKDTDLLKIHTAKDAAPKHEPITVLVGTMQEPARLPSYYTEQIGMVNTNIDTIIAAIKAKIEEHAKATIAINGSQVPPVVIGLRDRIKDQIKIKEDADAEREFLEDYVSRRQADAEKFVKRRDAMADRLEELKKFFKIKDDKAAPGNKGL